MKSMNNKRINIFTLLFITMCSYLLFLLLNNTNPTESGPLIIMIVFLIIYLISFGVTIFIFNNILKLSSIINLLFHITTKRFFYLSAIVAFAPIILISLNTLNKLDTMEIVLIIILIFLCCFYAVKRTAKG